jgi:hypothetical protein
VPYKAHVLSDQDAFDAADMSQRSSADWLHQLTRTMYECVACGRLWLETASNDLVAFLPDGHTGQVIGPTAGDRWKAPLFASWEDVPVVPGAPHGMLECPIGVRTAVARYESWNDLEAAYHDLLSRRRAEGTLRSALLKRNGQIVHDWSPEGD